MLLYDIRIMRAHLVIGKWKDEFCLQFHKTGRTKEKLISLYIFLKHKYIFWVLIFKLVHLFLFIKLGCALLSRTSCVSGNRCLSLQIITDGLFDLFGCQHHHLI